MSHLRFIIEQLLQIYRLSEKLLLILLIEIDNLDVRTLLYVLHYLRPEHRHFLRLGGWGAVFEVRHG